MERNGKNDATIRPNVRNRPRTAAAGEMPAVAGLLMRASVTRGLGEMTPWRRRAPIPLQGLRQDQRVHLRTLTERHPLPRVHEPAGIVEPARGLVRLGDGKNQAVAPAVAGPVGDGVEERAPDTRAAGA